MTQEIAPTPASTSTTTRKSSRRWIVGTIIGLIAFVGIWIAANLYYMNAKNELRRLRTLRDCMEVQLALHNYSDVCQRLPHAAFRLSSKELSKKGEQDISAPELFSWRFELAPFMDNPTREWNYIDPWDAPSNSEWRAAPNRFAYDANDLPHSASEDRAAMTRLLAITGPGTAFGDGKLEWPKHPRTLPGHLIVVVEVRNSGLHWMKPGDLDIRTIPRTINAPDGKGIGSICRNGFHVLFADGAIWFLSYDVPFQDLEKFFSIEGATKNDRRTVLQQFCLHEAMTPEDEEESSE